MIASVFRCQNPADTVNNSSRTRGEATFVRLGSGKSLKRIADRIVRALGGRVGAAPST
jgi:hypothetical protein